MIALHYHRRLPADVQAHLVARGVSKAVIHRYLIGWTGAEIAFPIHDRMWQIRSIEQVPDPRRESVSSYADARPTRPLALYGAEIVASGPKRVIICQSMLDRLVLLSFGFPAVAANTELGAFRVEWLSPLEGSEVFICCDRRRTQAARALNVALPDAIVAVLPPDIADVSQFLQCAAVPTAAFEALLADARHEREHEV